MSDVQKFLRELGQSLSDFLGQELPRITGTGWWERSVLSVLTSMQLENVERRQITGLTGLDLAALLRVLDQNWHAISRNKSLPWEVRNFIKETYSIRNRWVHAATHPAPKEDTYRDLDTMQRLAQAWRKDWDVQSAICCQGTQTREPQAVFIQSNQEAENCATPQVTASPRETQFQSNSKIRWRRTKGRHHGLIWFW
jgi:hypothetical protein